MSDRIFVVIDHGLFVSAASRLARDAETYYAPVWSTGFPTYHLSDIGKNLPDVIHVDDVYKLLLKLRSKKKDVTLVFPHIMDAGLQTYLREDGWQVWGSGYGDEIEIYRQFFKTLIQKLGLEVQPYEAITGMDALRAYLKKHDDKFVKLSCRLRGIMETFRHKTYWQTEPRLDELEHRLSIKKHETVFIVEDEIPTKLEVGLDTYSILGRYPKLALNGIEIKDCGYACVVQNWDDIPEEMRSVNEAMAGVLRHYGYRNLFSTEIRIAEDGTPYFIDPTCRFPSPSSECQQELYGNFADIVFQGARGQLEEPKITHPYAVEAVICSERAGGDDPQPIEFPEKIRDRVKLYFHRRVNGHDFTIPHPTGMHECGAVVGMGDTMDEAVEDCKALAEQISGDKLKVNIEALPEAVKELEIMEEKGMNVNPFKS